jgi:hypothetical protein
MSWWVWMSLHSVGWGGVTRGCIVVMNRHWMWRILKRKCTVSISAEVYPIKDTCTDPTYCTAPRPLQITGEADVLQVGSTYYFFFDNWGGERESPPLVILAGSDTPPTRRIPCACVAADSMHPRISNITDCVYEQSHTWLSLLGAS